MRLLNRTEYSPKYGVIGKTAIQILKKTLLLQKKNNNKLVTPKSQVNIFSAI